MVSCGWPATLFAAAKIANSARMQALHDGEASAAYRLFD
jgi:hypothetical protein